MRAIIYTTTYRGARVGTSSLSPSLSQDERRIPKRLRAELGSELHVEGVDSDSPKRLRAVLGSELHVEGVGSEVVDKVDAHMESSDEMFGVDRSGLELELCKTVNGKRNVGVQVGCEHFR